MRDQAISVPPTHGYFLSKRYNNHSKSIPVIDLTVPLQNENMVGRIAEIISEGSLSTQGYITIEKFVIAEALHPQFRLPVIRRQPENVKSYIVVQPSVCVSSIKKTECLY